MIAIRAFFPTGNNPLYVLDYSCYGNCFCSPFGRIILAEMGKKGGNCDSASQEVNDSFTSEDYECKICYNSFDLDRHTPKVLDCSHTFCRQCLDTLHSQEGRGGGVGCPLCRNRTPVPVEYRVDNLPDNIALTVSLPLQDHEHEEPSNTDVQRSPVVVSLPTSEEDNGSCCTCKTCVILGHYVCATCCCLFTVLFLDVGVGILIDRLPITANYISLLVISIIALLTVIITWFVYICSLCHFNSNSTSRFPTATRM